MSAQYVEQDFDQPPSGNDLPTYDDLAEQNGPNSRFGRWRGWIEKRAAERYADITHEERQRRRERGWGNNDRSLLSSSLPEISVQVEAPGPTDVVTPHLGPPLHIQTSSLTIQESPPPSKSDSTSNISLPFISQPLLPSHLKINHFGSRFLPHTTSQIRCILPVLAHRMILIGHDEGLSVLNLFPQEWSETGEVITKGPDQAEARAIWVGECVYQMSILEVEETGADIPQGVVLAVIGPALDAPTAGKDAESLRNVRMYPLQNLIRLAKSAVAQKGAKPLDLYRFSSCQMPQTPSKRHRSQNSIAKGLKSMRDSTQLAPEALASYSNFLSPTASSFSKPLPVTPGHPPLRQGSGDSSWDVVEDKSLQLATDFIPLASPGSRLVGASVISFATWCDENRKGKGTAGQLLAIATKSNIFLYETPKGERAYRFVKEFYTPLQPRSITFVHQAVSEQPRPSTETSPGRFHSHKRSDSGGLKGVINTSSSSTPLSYGTHLSIFIVFDKKAGWIRLADSAVGEVELGEDGGPQPPGLLNAVNTFSSTTSNATLRQRARLSFDIRESAAKWIAPCKCDVPIPGMPGVYQPVLILTRGKRTHILPSPLPTYSSTTAPLNAVFWKSHPKWVSPRVIHPEFSSANESPLLQLIAFTENGLEIQEMALSFMNNKGKGRAFPDDLIRVEEDLGGDAGFLIVGGNWDRFDQLYGTQTSPSGRTANWSRVSVDSTDFVGKMKQEEGVYGWCRKGLEDWRVFWVGGNQGGVSNGAEGVGSGISFSEEDEEDDMYW